MAPALLVGVIAAVVTAAVTPLVVRLAHRIGAVDVPADPRKVHKEPVPTLGGIGMIAGFLVALGVAALLPTSARCSPRRPNPWACSSGWA
jgi:UDP-N-acetylmuramyl pentapeptide phosphotransferase/UDP-N-acetylglucosamine-1-phosphate transferase